jgi:hypothetical protein
MRKQWVIALCFVLMSSILVTAAGPRGGPKKVQIEGKITTITANLRQITVGGVTVQVTDATAITMNDQILSFDDLKFGMTVRVCGKMDGDILIAEQINIKYLGK